MLSISSTSTSLFRQFFPQFYSFFATKFQSPCQQLIQTYHSSTSISAINHSCDNVISCIQDNLNEKDKLVLAVTSVLLGLAPTVLSILGSHTSETALLSAKRPLLGFLLSLGAPIVTPLRAFEQRDPRDFLLIPASERWQQPKLKPAAEKVLCFVEYTVALAAIANVTHATLQLAFMSTAVVLSCTLRWEFLFWYYFAAGIHAFGQIAFATRARWPCSSDQLEASWYGVINTLSRWFKDELRPCRQREPHTFQWGRENLASILMSAVVGFFTMVHIIYGTSLLSSVVLVGPGDAAVLIARFAASALVTRGLLLFELNGLRETLEVIPTKPSKAC